MQGVRHTLRVSSHPVDLPTRPDHRRSATTGAELMGQAADAPDALGGTSGPGIGPAAGTRVQGHCLRHYVILPFRLATFRATHHTVCLGQLAEEFKEFTILSRTSRRFVLCFFSARAPRGPATVAPRRSLARTSPGQTQPRRGDPRYAGGSFMGATSTATPPLLPVQHSLGSVAPARSWPPHGRVHREGQHDLHRAAGEAGLLHHRSPRRPGPTAGRVRHAGRAPLRSPGRTRSTSSPRP